MPFNLNFDRLKVQQATKLHKPFVPPSQRAEWEEIFLIVWRE